MPGVLTPDNSTETHLTCKAPEAEGPLSVRRKSLIRQQGFDDSKGDKEGTAPKGDKDDKEDKEGTAPKGDKDDKEDKEGTAPKDDKDDKEDNEGSGPKDDKDNKEDKEGSAPKDDKDNKEGKEGSAPKDDEDGSSPTQQPPEGDNQHSTHKDDSSSSETNTDGNTLEQTPEEVDNTHNASVEGGEMGDSGDKLIDGGDSKRTSQGSVKDEAKETDSCLLDSDQISCISITISASSQEKKKSAVREKKECPPDTKYSSDYLCLAVFVLLTGNLLCGAVAIALSLRSQECHHGRLFGRARRLGRQSLATSIVGLIVTISVIIILCVCLIPKSQSATRRCFSTAAECEPVCEGSCSLAASTDSTNCYQCSLPLEHRCAKHNSNKYAYFSQLDECNYHCSLDCVYREQLKCYSCNLCSMDKIQDHFSYKTYHTTLADCKAVCSSACTPKNTCYECIHS